MPKKIKLRIPYKVGLSPAATAARVVDHAKELCQVSLSAESLKMDPKKAAPKNEKSVVADGTVPTLLVPVVEKGVSYQSDKLLANARLVPIAELPPLYQLTTAAATAEPADQISPFYSFCFNYDLGPDHQASVEEHLRDYVSKHPSLSESEEELRPQVEAGVVALKFFRAKYGYEKYRDFVQVMEGFQSKRLDYDGVKQELLAKFGPDEELFQCVNLFLPPSEKFELPTTATTTSTSSGTSNTSSSSSKQTQTISSTATLEGGKAGAAGAPVGSPVAAKPVSVTTMSSKLTIPLDASVPISGSMPVPMLPDVLAEEQINPVYDPDKISNILLFLGQVKSYSEELFAATLEVFYRNQNSDEREKPFIYLRVYEQLMALYAEHPTLKQAYREFFGPIKAVSGADGNVSFQLSVAQPPPQPVPSRSASGNLDPLVTSTPGSNCIKCDKPYDSPHEQSVATVESAAKTAETDEERLAETMREKMHITKQVCLFCMFVLFFQFFSN